LLDLLNKTFPSMLTLLNVIFGSLAIIYSFHHDYKLAAIFILCAVIMDSLDGKMARKLDSTSEMGKELDSLCDLVSFGVAPAILIYSQVFYLQQNLYGLMVTIFFIVCGALRLARFNVLNIPDHFLGVPITLAGGLLALFSLFSLYSNQSLTLLVVLILSLLMISNIKTPKL